MQKLCLLIFIFCSFRVCSQTQFYWGEHGALNADSGIYALCSDVAGNIYAGGDFADSAGHLYVAKWDGNSWSELGDTGIAALNFEGGINSICTDPFGNIYAAGAFRDANYKYCVMKWNGIRWSELGTLNVAGPISGLCSDPAGDIYAAGIFVNTPTTSNYVAKWDGTSWSQLGTGSNALNANEFIQCITSDASGNVYVAGSFTDSSGYEYVAKWNGVSWSELGTGSVALNANSDIYTICFSPQGTLYAAGTFRNNSGLYYVAQWNGSTWSNLGPAGELEGEYRMVTDSAGNIYVADLENGVFYFNGSDWEMLNGVNTLYLNGFTYSLCSNKQGDVFTAGSLKDVAGHYYVAEYSPILPADLYVFLTSTSANCNAHGSVTTHVYSGTPPYTYKWSNNDTTTNVSGVDPGTYSVTVTDVLGRTATGLINVENGFNVVISGIVFNDVNDNCIFDGSDQLLTNYYVQALASNGASYYATTDANGQYAIEIPDSGEFEVVSNNFSTPCIQVRVCNYPADTIFIPHLCDSLNNVNLAVSSTGSGFDLAIHPGWYPADPGFIKEYWVMPYNLPPARDTGLVTIVFTYDPNLIYDSSQAPLPIVDTTAHTLTWVVDGSTIPYPNFDWYNERFISYFQVPSTLSLNYQLQSDFVILPYTGDCDTLNNHLHFLQPVQGSHDPNSKEVLPAGSVTEGDSIFTYTINYQNNGTDSTNFIIVKDTLSPYLDPISVVNLASSDKYSAFNISGTGILTWTFNPLRIPDSATNATTSKGFIIFSVKRKAGLPVGSTISNSASIYFDYNTGIQTNTVTDTVAISTGLPALNKLTGISLTAYPNPFSDLTHILVTGLNRKYDFELFDITGRLQLRKASLQSNEFDLPRGNLPSGIYLYRIIVGNEPAGYGKLVVE